MTIKHTWHPINPSMKSDIPDSGGEYIADDALVVRGMIETDSTEQTFSVYTPAITGTLERVIVIPDHNDVPGTVGLFDLEIYQHYIEAPPIFDGGAAPIADTLDILNGLGANLPSNAITHMGLTLGNDDISAPIVAQQLVNDVLRLAFSNWSDGTEDVRRCYVFLYFVSDSNGETSAGTAIPAEQFTHILSESEYKDSVNGQIQADLVYPVFEVLINSGNIIVYNYALGDNAGNPTETNGRAQVASITGDAFEVFDMTINLDKVTDGLVTRLAGTENVYFMLLYYDSDSAAWKWYPVSQTTEVVHIDASVGWAPAAAGDNICGLADENDQIESIYWNHVSGEQRIIGCFYSDTGVVADVELPWFLSVRREATD